jgi:hypothetical protein
LPQYWQQRSNDRARLSNVRLNLTSCEKHGLNAIDYLTDVLMRVQTHPASQIDELLPHRWKATRDTPPVECPDLLVRNAGGAAECDQRPKESYWNWVV